MDAIIMEIKRISENLMEIPYGRSIRNGEKILPPHYQQYANEMKRLINLLLSLYNLDNDCILVSEMNQIQSLYDNEIRQAIIDKDQRMREFYKLGYDPKLLSVSRTVKLITDRLNK